MKRSTANFAYKALEKIEAGYKELVALVDSCKGQERTDLVRRLGRLSNRIDIRGLEELKPEVLELADADLVWKDWSGGRSRPPVDGGKTVMIRMRDGKTERGVAACYAWKHHHESSYDIVAYSVL